MSREYVVDYHTFKFRYGDDDEKGGCTFVGGSWEDVVSGDLFRNKKIVMFSLPGAFTPTCSSKQLPGYEEMFSKFQEKGILEIYCVSVNDGFVMSNWFKNQEYRKHYY